MAFKETGIMNEGLHQAMAEATRLAQTGRLHEATALIQQKLRGGFAPEPGPDTPAANEPIDAEFTVVEPAPPVFTRWADRSAGSTEETGSPGKHAAPGATPHHESALADTLRRALKNPLGESVLKPQPDRTNPDVFAGGRFIEAAFTHEARTRAYKLYIPSGFHGQAMPLVVMLHGCTQGPDDFAAGTRMNALAEREGLFVLYPEQPASANPSRCWNWFKASDQHRGQGEPALLAGLTREIIGRYHLDERRVYVAGLSAGGAMAMVLGVNYPDIYAAIGVHSGLPYGAAHDLPSAFAAMQQGQPNPLPSLHGKAGRSGKTIHPVPAIVFHGDRDTTVHPGNGDQVLAQWAKAHSGGSAGTQLRVAEQRGHAPGGHGYTRSLYHDPDGRVVLERWRIHGAGHAWSGGSPQGSFTDPRGPDASVEMVRFFLQHARAPV
jgi:poly(hydroxyalkanoate) depolymerase family esterase